MELLDTAKLEYRKAIESDPDLLAPYYNLGFIYREQETYDSALALFGQIIEYLPEDENAYCYKGASFSAAGEFDSAYAYLFQAKDLNPDNHFVYYNLAMPTLHKKSMTLHCLL